MTADLFSPLRMGSLELENRIVMAPLTRARAGEGDVPKPDAATYYAQRAQAGLIISEASQITPQGKGYAWTPGIYSDAQIEGWKRVTDAVHAKGGRMFIQLWHVGRISHPELQENGALPVAPSAITPKAEIFTPHGMIPAVAPRALDKAEIPGIVADYRQAALNAIKAGFDGVEIHAANGYLIDQFMRDGTNQRSDEYGGSIANRLRFAREVVESVVGAIGKERVGIRISPLSSVNDMRDSNPEALFMAFVEMLNEFEPAYLHVVEGITRAEREPEGGFDLQKLRKAFKGFYMGNNGYTKKLAQERLDADQVDLVAFGRPFIANPDLVERFKQDSPLNTPNPKTFYGGGAEGYLDYPMLGSTAA